MFVNEACKAFLFSVVLFLDPSDTSCFVSFAFGVGRFATNLGFVSLLEEFGFREMKDLLRVVFFSSGLVFSLTLLKIVLVLYGFVSTFSFFRGLGFEVSALRVLEAVLGEMRPLAGSEVGGSSEIFWKLTWTDLGSSGLVLS